MAPDRPVPLEAGRSRLPGSDVLAQAAPLRLPPHYFPGHGAAGVQPQGQSEQPSYDHRLPTGAAGPRIIEDPNMNRPAPVLAVAWSLEGALGRRKGRASQRARSGRRTEGGSERRA